MPGNAEIREAFLVLASLAGETTEATMQAGNVSGAGCSGGILQEELDLNTTWYVDADGGLDLDRLLEAFQDFFRRHSEHWKNRFLYEEAWPQILLQAYLHRVVNGGGRIEREYGLGRGRVDLLIMWPQRPPPG